MDRVVQHYGMLALFGNSLLEAGEHAAAAQVFQLLAKRDTGELRWQIGLCYCLLCARDVRRARMEVQTLEKMSGVDRHTKRLLRMRLEFVAART